MKIRPALPALLAAVLFGASTPLAKLLVGDVAPLLLAGLLYLGSGVGLATLLIWRRLRDQSAAAELRIPRADVPWLLGAIFFGGVIGPVLLMRGLVLTDGATASLLLNVEGVLTALLAWLVFKENADRRIVLGMAAIVAGGVLLSWAPGGAQWTPGAVLVVGACLAWSIDNNLTRKVSANDAMLVACLKGLIAGVCNAGLAMAAGTPWPAWPAALGAMVLGFAGYGLSLTLFVVALRGLGTSRTGAYFSVAPLFGVLLSLAIWPAWPEASFWLAGLLMMVGVWLHVSERHEHEHSHPALMHAHRHRHDPHHQHPHDFPWDGLEPHTHAHAHEAMTHRHAHFPDAHHRHQHPSRAA